MVIQSLMEWLTAKSWRRRRLRTCSISTAALALEPGHHHRRYTGFHFDVVLCFQCVKMCLFGGQIFLLSELTSYQATSVVGNFVIHHKIECLSQKRPGVVKMKTTKVVIRTRLDFNSIFQKWRNNSPSTKMNSPMFGNTTKSKTVTFLC